VEAVLLIATFRASCRQLRGPEGIKFLTGLGAGTGEDHHTALGTSQIQQASLLAL